MEFEKLLILIAFLLTTISTITLIIKSKNIFFRFYLIGIAFVYIVPFGIGEYINNSVRYINESYINKVFGLLIIITTNISIFLIMNIKTPVIKNKKSRKINGETVNIIFISGQLYTLFLGGYAIYLLVANRGLISNNDILRANVTPLINSVTFYGVLVGIPLIIASIHLITFLDRKRNIDRIGFILFSALSFIIVFTQGQRTSLIINIMTLMLIYVLKESENKKKQTFIMVCTGIGCILLLIYYSMNFKRITMGSEDLIARLITSDVDLNWTLWYATENIKIVGNDIIPYPLAGYIYILTIFIPRSLWENKGFSTASWFTQEYIFNVSSLQSNIGELSWGYKFGVLVDLILNLGVLGIILYCVVVGYLFNQFNKKYSDSILIKSNLAVMFLYMTFNGIFNIVIYKIVPLIFAVLVIDKYRNNEINLMKKTKGE